MNPQSICCLLILVYTLSCFPCLESKPVPHQRLLVILLDGFRFDYLNQSSISLPGFDKIAKQGVKAGGFVPDTPSLSYPNYYSIMTGLHTESHGMTGNYMYDVSRNESFLLGTNPEQFHAHWWDGGDPLWITAARQNKTSHMYYWPGCEVQIRGLRPTSCRQYGGIPTFDELHFAINESLAFLQSGKTDFAAIYFEQTDHTGHKNGPFSSELNEVIRSLDQVMSDLVDRLSDPGLSDVNLLIFSDHGMTEVNTSFVVDISEKLSPSDYIVILGGGAFASIYTHPGQEDQVYEKIANLHPNMTVYRKKDLPERWHYKQGPYVAPLTAMADLGWFIITPAIKGRTLPAGAHGYDNRYSDMQGTFLAMGPAFKSGVTVERLDSVDVYQVMCNIPRLQPSPNNGTLSHITPLLRVAGDYCDSGRCAGDEYYCCGYNQCCRLYRVWEMWYFWCGLLFALCLLLMLVFFWKRRSHSRLPVDGYTYTPLGDHSTCAPTSTTTDPVATPSGQQPAS